MKNCSLLDICRKKHSKEISDSWDELAKQFDFNSGEALRCWFKRQRKSLNTSPIIENQIETNIKENNLELIEIEKKKIQILDQKREYRNLIREQARYEHIKDEINKSIQDLSNKYPFKFNYVKNRESQNKELLAVFGDWHVGLFANNAFNNFDTNELNNRVNILVNNIIQIGKEQKARVLNIFSLGDMINGNIHISARITNVEDVIKQTITVSEILSNVLHILSNEFESVRYYSVVGNHGRVDSNKDSSIYEENFENIIDWYLKSRLNNIHNLEFIENKIDKEIIVAEIMGKKIYGVHGDKDKVNNVVSNLSLMLKEVPYMICLGHKHHFQEDRIHDVQVVMNGSLCGTDSYAKNIRCTGKATQVVMVFNEKGRYATFNIELNQ